MSPKALPALKKLRWEQRELFAPLSQPPPRFTRKEPVAAPFGSVPPAYGVPYQSHHHSGTFPAMSFNPYPFAANEPTGLVAGEVPHTLPIALNSSGPRS
jgi:hypothetical protein